MSYYYWDNNFKNKQGLSLQECSEKFGTKLVSFHSGKYKVVFLDSRRSLGNSWMLWFKDGRGKQVPVVWYEATAERVQGTF
jgi:hypothetical protein